MKKRNIIMVCTLLVGLLTFGIGTVAYFRQSATGNVTGNAGSLNVVVNEANAVLNETFNITLTRSESENFIIPGDSGYFDVNINASGSTSDIKLSIDISRNNLPNNLKFYVNESHTREFMTEYVYLEEADTMTSDFRIYWYWDATKDDANDSLFMGKTINANVNVSAVGQSLVYLYDAVSPGAILDNDVEFDAVASDENGNGLMMLSSTQSDTYPIVYYRGDVTNNNVIYGGFCWLIVRTTETGGVKIIYNGLVNEDGSCNNNSGVGGEAATSTYTDAFIVEDMTGFNTAHGSAIVSVGYMYNYDNWYFDLDSFKIDAPGYISHLDDQSRLDNGTGKYTQNKYDSNIKGIIDSWYKDNILNTASEDLLEDTVWCSDRSVVDNSLIEEASANYSQFLFSAGSRIFDTTSESPTLVCSRDVDKFTVERENGNGDLTYPIGLLTADEIVLAGHPYDEKTTTYLAIPCVNWTMTPMGFGSGQPWVFMLGTSLGHMEVSFDQYGGVRPAVSLGHGTVVISGNGSFDTPYVVG